MNNRILAASERILERNPVEEMLKAFALFDEDKTGKISLRNLRKIARFARMDFACNFDWREGIWARTWRTRSCRR